MTMAMSRAFGMAFGEVNNGAEEVHVVDVFIVEDEQGGEGEAKGCEDRGLEAGLAPGYVKESFRDEGPEADPGEEEGNDESARASCALILFVEGSFGKGVKNFDGKPLDVACNDICHDAVIVVRHRRHDPKDTRDQKNGPSPHIYKDVLGDADDNTKRC